MALEGPQLIGKEDTFRESRVKFELDFFAATTISEFRFERHVFRSGVHGDEHSFGLPRDGVIHPAPITATVLQAMGASSTRVKKKMMDALTMDPNFDVLPLASDLEMMARTILQRQPVDLERQPDPALFPKKMDEVTQQMYFLKSVRPTSLFVGEPKDLYDQVLALRSRASIVRTVSRGHAADDG